MDPVFDDPAIEAILNASDGTARVINKLCNASLVIGHSQSVNRINADIAMQAINECTLAIFGKQINGRFLCIPNYSIG